MKQEIFRSIIKKIAESKNIIISTHVNPDGDGIGAGIALFLALNKFINKRVFLDKRIRFIIDDKVPGNLKFLKGTEFIEEYKNYSSSLKNDLLISLDAGDLDRIGRVKEVSGDIINIDHHVSNTNYGIINYVDSNSASTSEIIYDFIFELGVKIDMDMGEGLYAGIVCDTGNFKHSNVKKSTFEKAASLIEIGVSNTKIIQEFLERKKYSSLKLYGRALEKTILIEDKGFIYTVLSKEDFDELKGDKFDAEGISEFILQCDTAKTSLFLRENGDGSIKGSMRTKEDQMDLNDVVSIFGGGGHKKAAGFSSNLNFNEIIEKIIEIL